MKQLTALDPTPLNYPMNLMDERVVKTYFKGEYLRKIFIVLYDIDKKKSYKGQIYLTTKNVLLYLDNFRGKTKLGLGEAIIYELEQSDVLTIENHKKFDLTEIFNAADYSEKIHIIETYEPISYILINNTYVVVEGMVPESGMLWGGLTVYFTAKDYKQEIDNLVTVTRQILDGKTVNSSLSLPGLSPQKDRVAKIVGALIIIGTLLAFVVTIFLK